MFMDAETARIKQERITDADQLAKYAKARAFRNELVDFGVKYEVGEKDGNIYFEFFV